MKLTIAHKLGGGFGLMIALVAVLAAVVYFQTGSVGHKTDEAIERNVPAVEYGLTLQGEIHHALSMHRGYMILGLESLAQERLDTWDKIDEVTDRMDEIAAGWTDQALVKRWNEAKATMANLREAQDRIAAVSHTPDDRPADQLFYDEAGPYGEEIVASLKAILDIEEALEATPQRKQLVRRIAAAESHLLKSRYAIAAYLVTGQATDLEHVRTCISDCQASVDRLMTMTGLFNAEQQEHFDAYLAARERFLGLANRAVAVRGEPDFCVSENICLNVVTPYSQQADELLGGIVAAQSESKDAAVANIRSASATMTGVVLFVTLGAVALGAAVAFILSRQMVGAISRITVFCNSLAQKNLRIEPLDVKTGDNLQDLAESVNQMHESIREIIIDVSRTASEVAGASTQISASNDQIAGGVANQARQVEQISAAITQMTESVRQVAEQSDQARENAQQSTELATNGGDVVQQTIAGMNSINEAVSGSAASVSELGKRSEQIGAIIDVINDIADQTNLLALNAAIEAARAGEHGRGFAVVADEVRKLAERTQEATEEVGSSVRAIQEETTTAVDRMRRGTEEVTQGVKLAGSAGESLKAIFTGTQEVTAMIREIASAAEEQAKTAEDVNRGITEIGDAAQTASESTREASQASTQLSAKAEELRGLVEQFAV